jgi:membrane-associated HD superfamily phosphohydrolase
MIKNTEAFYTKAKQYQDKRAQLVSDYESKVESMKRYEGSSGYQEDLERLQKAHNEALTALQGEYRSSLRTILKGMDEALSRRKVNAPTNDQLNLIHLLKMRDKVSQEELDRVFEMVKDNGIAVGVIQEVARSNGIMKNYEARCEEMSSSYAQKVINGLNEAVEDWIMYDTPRAGRVANKFNAQHYGAPEAKLKKRPLFEDMDGCFSDLAGLDQEGLRLFSEAVDTE